MDDTWSWAQWAETLARTSAAVLKNELSAHLAELARLAGAELLSVRLRTGEHELLLAASSPEPAPPDRARGHFEREDRGFGVVELEWCAAVAAPDGLPRMVLRQVADAVGLAHGLALDARIAHALTAKLNTLAVPAMLVEPGGRLVHANAIADRLLSSMDGLRLRDHGLSCTDAEADGALRAALGEFAAQGPMHAIQLSAPRVGKRRPLLLALEPAPNIWRSPTPIGPWVLVVVDDPDSGPAPSPERLVEIYGLSPAEAALAVNVASGVTLEEIAAQRGVRVGTLRTQLKRVMAKTHTYRQAEVVRLLTRPASLLVLAGGSPPRRPSGSLKSLSPHRGLGLLPRPPRPR